MTTRHQILQELDTLSDDLHQQVLQFIQTLRKQHQNPPNIAWDTLEALTGTVEAPADWSAQHHHYLYGTPKQPQ